MKDESGKETTRQRARRAFTHLVGQQDAAIDLAQAALLIAAEEYPELNIPHCLKQIDELAIKVRAHLGVTQGDLYSLPSEIKGLDAIHAMNEVLFAQEQFHGNTADYDNPRNSFLNEVLEKREGIPITLSLVYLEVGRRVGLDIEGIGLPFHFIVRCVLTPHKVYVDPFEQGRLLSEDDCRERVYKMFRNRTDFNPKWLQPVTHRQFLMRMLANLKHIYINQEDYQRALAVCDRILLLAPNSAIEHKDRGMINFHLKYYARAQRDFNAYLELAPNAHDLQDIKQQIRAIRQIMAMMN